MENTFEFRFTDKKETLYEYYRAVSGMSLKSLIIVLVVLTGFGGLACYFGIYSILYFIIGIALICGFLYYYPYIATSNNLKVIRQQCGGEVPETVVRFGEKIELTEVGNQVSIDYESIAAVMKLKHSFVLMLGKTDGIILPMACFEENSLEEFKKFLQKECPDVKI